MRREAIDRFFFSIPNRSRISATRRVRYSLSNSISRRARVMASSIAAVFLSKYAAMAACWAGEGVLSVHTRNILNLQGYIFKTPYQFFE